MLRIPGACSREVQQKYKDAGRALRRLRDQSLATGSEGADALSGALDWAQRSVSALAVVGRVGTAQALARTSAPRDQAADWTRRAGDSFAQLDGETAGALRDAAAAQSRQFAETAAQAAGQLSQSIGQQASAAKETVGAAIGEAKEALGPRVGAMSQTVAKQAEQMAPRLADLVSQSVERATQAGAQATGALAPRLASIAGGVAEQRDALAPVVAGLATQALERASQAGSQAAEAAGSWQQAAAAAGPTVAETAGGTALAVGNAFDATGRAVRSTVNNIFWIGVLGAIAVLLYAPKDEQRAKLMAGTQEWMSYLADIVMELRGREE